MELKQLLETLTPAIYEAFKRGIEIGKWPDGRRVSDEQRELCMQAVIAYEMRQPETQRTGYVPPKNSACELPDSDEKPLVWYS